MGVFCAPLINSVFLTPVCETQQITNYPHNVQHHTKYLVLYVLFHTIPTIQKQSKHFERLIYHKMKAAWDTSIARTTVFINNVSPY